MTPVVPGIRHAGTNASGIEIGALVRDPRETMCHVRRWSRAERHATANTYQFGRKQWPECRRGHLRTRERALRDVDDVTVGIAQRPVRADQLSDAPTVH